MGYNRSNNNRRCVIDNCNLAHSAKGYCNIHYQRLIRGLPFSGLKKTILQRIMEKIIIQDNGCWLWSGALSGGDGRSQYKYGYITINKRQKRVHRVLYEITNKITLDDFILLHNCDRPQCVNPEHMTVGTTQDNVNDMIKKNRQIHPKGIENHSKLSEDDVISIRKISHLHTNVAIAKMFNITPSTARNIIIRKKWKHIT